MQTLRHVVAGTDFSEGAAQALELALALAVTAGVPVTVAHVCELGADDFDDRLRMRRAAQALSELVARHQSSGVAVTGVLRTGKPSQKLDNVAVEVGAGLIVIGRSGAGRGPSVALGSVADELVRSANRPVLTVALNFDRETNSL